MYGIMLFVPISTLCAFDLCEQCGILNKAKKQAVGKLGTSNGKHCENYSAIPSIMKCLVISHLHICECHTSCMTHVEYLIRYGSVSIISHQECHHFIVTLLSSYVEWSRSIKGLGRDNTIL